MNTPWFNQVGSNPTTLSRGERPSVSEVVTCQRRRPQEGRHSRRAMVRRHSRGSNATYWKSIPKSPSKGCRYGWSTNFLIPRHVFYVLTSSKPIGKVLSMTFRDQRQRQSLQHRNGDVVILTAFFVIRYTGSCHLTTSGAASDKIVFKTMTLPFQWYYHFSANKLKKTKKKHLIYLWQSVLLVRYQMYRLRATKKSWHLDHPSMFL